MNEKYDDSVKNGHQEMFFLPSACGKLKNGDSIVSQSPVTYFFRTHSFIVSKKDSSVTQERVWMMNPMGWIEEEDLLCH